MKYVTTIDRRAEARGLKIGQDQTRAFVQRLLNRRFGELEEAIGIQISSLTIDKLEALGEALLDFTTIDDLTQWLDTQ